MYNMIFWGKIIKCLNSLLSRHWFIFLLDYNADLKNFTDNENVNLCSCIPTIKYETIHGNSNLSLLGTIAVSVLI